MATAIEIHNKVKEYLAPGAYEITEIDYIPEIDDRNIAFGNKGVKLTASVLYLDMRGSTDVIKQHHKYTVAKLQKAYLHVAAQVVSDNGGHVRSFNGDGILAFFPRNWKETIRNAVKAAMQIKFMLTEKSKAEFERYHSIDFGIGIEHGDLFVTRVGTPRNPNNNDLTWVGFPVNTAVRLGDKAMGPRHIRISSYVYENLLDDVKYHDQEVTDYWGNKTTTRTNMWQQTIMDLHGSRQYVYETGYYWTING
jgi:adenylate cyclase